MAAFVLGPVSTGLVLLAQNGTEKRQSTVT